MSHLNWNPINNQLFVYIQTAVKLNMKTSYKLILKIIIFNRKLIVSYLLSTLVTYPVEIVRLMIVIRSTGVRCNADGF